MSSRGGRHGGGGGQAWQGMGRHGGKGGVHVGKTVTEAGGTGKHSCYLFNLKQGIP